MTRVKSVSNYARFWSVDFHVHTPGSQDAKPENYGSPADIVRAAIAAGLDAIAITDHNTAAWCSSVAEAASGTSLVVLPGVEISTTEGHLLAIWEEGTAPTEIEELLVKLEIGHADRGKLDIAAEVGFAHAARKVHEAGGIAVPAHAEKEKGLLRLSVKAHLKKTLLNDAISAIEVVFDDTIAEVARTVSGARTLACVRGSDTWDPDRSCHALSGIGVRRTWIKATRPDLVGIRHALADPELRVSLTEPPRQPPYGFIESVSIGGGFLSGQEVHLSPDLNCLLGGTGAGKSLVLEAIRFALHQQVDGNAFPGIRQEVDSRMGLALTSGGTVIVHVRAGERLYRVERSFAAGDSGPSKVFQRSGDDWAEVELDPAALCPLAAFSQGEILEYSREPVGRMTLVDASLELGEVSGVEEGAILALRANAKRLIQAKNRVGELKDEAAGASALEDQVRKLVDLFKTEAVKEQASWTEEKNALDRDLRQVNTLTIPTVDLPASAITHKVAANSDLVAIASSATAHLRARVDAALAEAEAARSEASEALALVWAEWESRFEAFKFALDAELAKVDSDSSLAALRSNLELLQGRLAAAQSARQELEEIATPSVAALESERETVISTLHSARVKKREMRRERVVNLNAKAAGFVKLDIPAAGDESAFRAALDEIKVGSRVREEFLNQLALRTHPLKFARCMWTQRLSDIADPDNGIEVTSLAKLLANIDERDLWQQLLDIQTIDRPDVLTVKFRKPNDQTYTSIEELAHGQRCTAILVVLLADGDTPVIVDQPEDALHAPWIEEYLVDRLRSLRGTRQYIFATRSPGIVVSGDAEQIVTMKATAGHGMIEAAGSLERHDLNRLALDHLEGGPIPFRRRTKKLEASVLA